MRSKIRGEIKGKKTKAAARLELRAIKSTAEQNGAGPAAAMDASDAISCAATSASQKEAAKRAEAKTCLALPRSVPLGSLAIIGGATE